MKVNTMVKIMNAGMIIIFKIFKGESFGELALLENKRRAATIICKE